MSTSLRSQCVSAAWVSIGYIESFLREARGGVWALLRGDRQRNLEALANSAAPTENENLFKIYELMRIGFNTKTILQGLDALDQISWTALGVEQGHASASGVMKLHREYGVATLMARSMVSQFRPLLAASPEERKLRAAMRSDEVLGKKQLKRFTGRQLYLKELVELAQRWKAEGRKVPPNVHVHIMHSHGKGWASMPAAHKADFEQRAADHRAQAQEELDSSRFDLAHRIATLQAEIACSGSSSDMPLRLSGCRLSDSERLELEALFLTEPMSASHVSEWRERDEKPFQEPSASALSVLVLNSVALPFLPAKHPRPSWVPLICWNRTFFQAIA